MKNWLKRIVPIVSVIPFAAGSAGYMLAGEGATNALYASFALYFTNPVSDAYNLLIELARWTAPLVTATAVLYAVRGIWNNICWKIRCFSSDSVAVYCDSKLQIRFDGKTAAIYPGRALKPAAKSHIIMLSSDMDSLKFYEEHKARLKGKAVYIGLREMEYGLLREEPDVSFYDVNGAVARSLWKDIGVWRKQKERLTVSIYGGGMLGQNILQYGLLLNLYSLRQEISYHFISDNDFYQLRHGAVNTYNGDCVRYHSTDDKAVWEVLRNSDIIIAACELSAELLQTISIVGRESEIYYYSPKAGDLGERLQFLNLQAFGRDEVVFTDENIRKGHLIEKAKALNEEYAAAYQGEADWNKLNGFLKCSNISSADFMEIMEYLLRIGVNTDTESLAELEHIRWCRFHHLNYWSYGIPENGKNKDEVHKIHKCLCGYSELAEADKDKDRAIVERVRSGLSNQ